MANSEVVCGHHRSHPYEGAALFVSQQVRAFANEYRSDRVPCVIGNYSRQTEPSSTDIFVLELGKVINFVRRTLMKLTLSSAAYYGFGNARASNGFLYSYSPFSQLALPLSLKFLNLSLNVSSFFSFERFPNLIFTAGPSVKVRAHANDRLFVLSRSFRV